MKRRLLPLLMLLFAVLTVHAAADYTIFPTPQKMSVGQSSVTFGPRVTIVAAADIDDVTIRRACEVLRENHLSFIVSEAPAAEGCSLVLSVDGSLASENGNHFDHHTIRLTREGDATLLTVTGEHTNAVFFGLATVEQMLEQTEDHTLKVVDIDDWSDQQIRGIVEGYYGFPYTIDTRIDLMEWGKRWKMNTFIYGPKGDPYHLGAWRDDYPSTVSAEYAAMGMITKSDLRRLAEASATTKVDFIWAAHPAFSNPIDLSTDEGTERGATELLRKFDHLYDLGVRRFGIFLDDISVADGLRDCERHAALLRRVQDALADKYNKVYTNAADTVRPLFFVPTPYALNFARKSELEQYFGAISTIQPEISVFFTGSGVWSNISERDCGIMSDYVKRRVAMWWNFPCNDNNDRNIYLMDVDSYYRTDPSLVNCLGIVCNPMAQGEASKVSLFGVMDYCWNVKAFNSRQTWEQAFSACIHDEAMAKAYRQFAPWAMAAEPDELGAAIEAFKTAPNEDTKAALLAKLDAIKQPCETLRGLKTSQRTDDRLLWNEIHCWVEKLSEMCALTQVLVEAYDPNIANSAKAQQRFADTHQELMERSNALMTSERYIVVQKEGAGTSTNTSSGIVTPSNKYLWPFIGWLKKSLFGDDRGASMPLVAASISEGTGIWSGTPEAFADGDYATFLWTNGNQRPDDCYAVTLERKARVEAVRIVLMAGDRMKEGTVEISNDGKRWKSVNTVSRDELIPCIGYDACYKDVLVGKKTKFIRFRLNAPDATKWFKIVDIEALSKTSK